MLKKTELALAISAILLMISMAGIVAFCIMFLMNNIKSTLEQQITQPLIISRFDIEGFKKLGLLKEETPASTIIEGEESILPSLEEGQPVLPLEDEQKVESTVPSVIEI